MILRMNHLLRMMTELWDLAGPERRVRFGTSRRDKAPLTPHMLIGLPSASKGVRFLLNFLPPIFLGISIEHERLSQDLWHTSSGRLAKFASSSPAPGRHVYGEIWKV